MGNFSSTPNNQSNHSDHNDRNEMNRNEVNGKGSALFTETPTVEGNYPQSSDEAPMGDHRIPKNEVQMARNETNSKKKPKSHNIDAKTDVDVRTRDHPIANTTAAENVLEHHTT